MSWKTELKLPYGKGAINFSLPRARLLGILENDKKNPQRGVKRLLRESLDGPSDKIRLKDALFNKRKVLVVVPDATRSAHLKDLLPDLLKRFAKKSRTVDIIIATGLHKAQNLSQLKELLGDATLKRYNVISHRQAKSSLINLGSAKNRVPIVLNRNLKGHDFIISIGVIEPHLYAGYSGGAKTIAIGLAGEATINATHNVNFLDDPLTKLGSIKKNPFQDTLWNILDKIRVGFCINVVNDSKGHALKFFSGDVRRAFRKGVEFAKSVFEVEVKYPSSVVICGVGHPKDVNLYQASRAINYVLNVESPVLKKGGALIVAAELGHGAGDGVAEVRFYKILKGMRSPEDFLAKIRRSGCIAGEHRAYMVAKALLEYKIVFVTMGKKRFMSGLPFPNFETIENALRYVSDELGRDSDIYVIPRALSTIASSKP